jgi:hypothetical protein
MSWTLDREKAIWFANRSVNRGVPELLTAKAMKRDVHAFKNNRNEQEIVIDKFRIKLRETLTL